MQLMNQNKKPQNGMRRQKNAVGGVTTSSKPTEYSVKKQHKQKFQHQKNSHEASSETKKNWKKNSDPKAPKMATWSSSRLKLVPEKLKK